MMKKRRSPRSCCVPGCRSAERKNPELKFYSFPGRDYQVERKKKWIISVRRPNVNGMPWVPAPHTRICSRHFAGGKRSEDPRNEAYNPTIFPWNNEDPHNNTASESHVGGFKQRNDITQIIAKPMRTSLMGFDEIPPILLSPALIYYSVTTREIGIQTDENRTAFDEEPLTVLYCWQDGIKNEASTQTIIITSSIRDVKKIIARPEFVNVKTENELNDLNSQEIAATADVVIKTEVEIKSEFLEDPNSYQLTV